MPVARGPMGRYGHAVCMHDTRFFVFGGQAEGAFMNDLWAYDIKQRRSCGKCGGSPLTRRQCRATSNIDGSRSNTTHLRLRVVLDISSWLARESCICQSSEDFQHEATLMKR